MPDQDQIPDEVYEESIARLRAMSQDERVALLKEIGILTADGHLAERYGGESAPELPPPAREQAAK